MICYATVTMDSDDDAVHHHVKSMAYPTLAGMIIMIKAGIAGNTAPAKDRNRALKNYGPFAINSRQ